MFKVTKVKEFCLFYFYKKDGLPGRSQRRRPEQSDSTTLGILGTLAHFRHSLRFVHSSPIIFDHAQRTWFKKN
jgi:hypothetical protein